MLDLVLQLDPCRVELTGCRLLRVAAAAISPRSWRRSGGQGANATACGAFWWLEARNLRQFADELRRASDPLFQTR